MQLAMMKPADRDGELVAHSTSQCTRLRKGEVVRIRWYAAAHKARLPQNELPVVFITQANRFAQSVDHVAAGLLLGPPRKFVARTRIRPTDGHYPLVRGGMKRPSRGKIVRSPTEGMSLRSLVTIQAIAEGREPCLKPLLDNFGIFLLSACSWQADSDAPRRPPRPPNL
jgi:hypothetical protein